MEPGDGQASRPGAFARGPGTARDTPCPPCRWRSTPTRVEAGRRSSRPLPPWRVPPRAPRATAGAPHGDGDSGGQYGCHVAGRVLQRYRTEVGDVGQVSSVEAAIPHGSRRCDGAVAPHMGGAIVPRFVAARPCSSRCRRPGKRPPYRRTGPPRGSPDDSTRQPDVARDVNFGRSRERRGLSRRCERMSPPVSAASLAASAARSGTACTQNGADDGHACQARRRGARPPRKACLPAGGLQRAPDRGDHRRRRPHPDRASDASPLREPRSARGPGFPPRAAEGSARPAVFAEAGGVSARGAARVWHTAGARLRWPGVRDPRAFAAARRHSPAGEPAIPGRRRSQRSTVCRRPGCPGGLLRQRRVLRVPPGPCLGGGDHALPSAGRGRPAHAARTDGARPGDRASAEARRDHPGRRKDLRQARHDPSAGEAGRSDPPRRGDGLHVPESPRP